MKKRRGNEIIDYLENIIYKDKQVQNNGVHLTVKKISSLTERGDIDFGGSEYGESEIREIHPEKISPDDKYGWWSLSEGEYLIVYNEKIRDSIPQEDIIFLQPALRLVRNGSYHPTLIINNQGSITTTLFVGKRGLKIKENARISKLLIISGNH